MCSFLPFFFEGLLGTRARKSQTLSWFARSTSLGGGVSGNPATANAGHGKARARLLLVPSGSISGPWDDSLALFSFFSPVCVGGGKGKCKNRQGGKEKEDFWNGKCQWYGRKRQREREKERERERERAFAFPSRIQSGG